MLYNIKKKEIKNDSHCLSCEKYDKTKKKCNGLGVICFAYDSKTKTIIDSKTGLPLNLK